MIESNTYIDEIISHLHKSDVQIVHYIGKGNQGLLEAIIDDESLKLTCLIQSGYRPVWLPDGIACYSEGGPKLADALIRDCNWDWPEQFDDILTWSHGPRRPPVVILKDEAILNGKHPFYDWSETEGVYFGQLKKDHNLDYPKEVREMIMKQDRFMRGER